jgi:hypothetical protein
VAHPVSAVTFDAASYTQDAVHVSAVVQAQVPWESPFTRTINLSIAVAPQLENITSVSITEVLVSIHAEEPGGDYLLLTSRNYVLPEPVTDEANATTSLTVELSGTGTGDVCYFGISVEGSYSNSTGTFAYSTISPEDLVGPFVISLSVASPQFLVGLGFIIFFLVITGLGVTAVRRIRSSPKRRPLLES